MDFSLSDHQLLIRNTVRQFMEAEVRPSVKQRDREERFPIEEIRKLAADLRVHLSDMIGTGKEGKITEADVKNAAAQLNPGLLMFKVKLGQPRNKLLLRMMEDPEKRRAIDKAELSFY